MVDIYLTKLNDEKNMVHFGCIQIQIYDDFYLNQPEIPVHAGFIEMFNIRLPSSFELDVSDVDCI